MPERCRPRAALRALSDAESRRAVPERGSRGCVVAKRAGVGPGTLYRHFPTLEALQEAVYRDA